MFRLMMVAAAVLLSASGALANGHGASEPPRLLGQFPRGTVHATLRR